MYYVRSCGTRNSSCNSYSASSCESNVVSKQTETVHNANGSVTVTETIKYADGRTVTKTSTTSGCARNIQNCSAPSVNATATPTETEEEPEKQTGSKSLKEDGQWTKFELESLEEHNKYRAKHGVPPLKLNREICTFATEWAQYIASRNCLQHRQNNKYGENCYMTSGGSITGASAVKAWYDEIKYYQFGYGGFSSNTGHFTQVVWKGSKELGIGFAKSPYGGTYVVANYDPPGNYQGQFRENVPPPTR